MVLAASQLDSGVRDDSEARASTLFMRMIRYFSIDHETSVKGERAGRSADGSVHAGQGCVCVEGGEAGPVRGVLLAGSRVALHLQHTPRPRGSMAAT